MRVSGKSLFDRAADFLTTVAHLKLIGVAAYALSPAFRSFTNSAVTAGIGQLTGGLGLAATAATKVVSAVSPALQFFTRLSVPVAAAVGAFTALNAVWQTGADLLSKYADRQRELFGSNVDADLAKLTKFQDPVPLEVVNRAQELGSRLQTAKDKLAEFAKVQLDLTDPALKLQAVWVGIVEAIAKGVGLLPTLGDKMTSLAQQFGNLPFWKLLASGQDQSAIIDRINAQNGTSSQQQESQDAARARGITLLPQAMQGGTSFAERFSNAISDLASPQKTEAITQMRGEFERLVNSIGRSSAAMEADAKTVGQSAGEVTRLRTEFRLLEAAAQDIAKNGGKLEDYADSIKKVADRAGEAAAALAKAQVASQIKFDTGTLGLSRDDTRIAQQLRGLYGDDIPAALASSEAASLRFNNSIRDLKDTAEDFAKSFVNGLLQGKSASEALTGSLQSLSQKLADKAVDNLLNGNFVGAAISGAAAAGSAKNSGLFGGEDEKPADSMPVADNVIQFKPKVKHVGDQHRQIRTA